MRRETASARTCSGGCHSLSLAAGSAKYCIVRCVDTCDVRFSFKKSGLLLAALHAGRRVGRDVLISKTHQVGRTEAFGCRVDNVAKQNNVLYVCDLVYNVFEPVRDSQLFVVGIFAAFPVLFGIYASKFIIFLFNSFEKWYRLLLYQVYTEPKGLKKKT